MVYYVFVAATAVIAFVAVALFILRAEEVRAEMNNKRDRLMIAYLALAIVFLFAFTIFFAEFAGPEISAPINAGLVLLLGLAMVYEIYLVLRSGDPAESQQN